MKKLNELQSYLTRLRGLMLTLIILCSIGSGNVWADSQSFNKDDFPLSTSSTKTPITVTFSAKSISGQQIRFNSGATVTFTSSSGKITGIAVSTNSTNQYIKDMGQLSLLERGVVVELPIRGVEMHLVLR